MNEDPREGWPSASGAEANSLCPPRFLAQRGMPELPESREAESSTAVHAALAGQPIRQLTSEEHDALERYRALEAKILESWHTP